MKVIMKSIFLLALILSFMNCQETQQESSQNLRSNNEEQQNQTNLDNNLNETSNENSNNIDNNNNNNELDEPTEDMTKEEKCLYDTVSNCSNQSQPVSCLSQLANQMECFESKCSTEKLGSTAKEHIQVCFEKYCKTDNQDVINVNNQLLECLSANQLVAAVVSLVALVIMF